jgi:hypothetical protein
MSSHQQTSKGKLKIVILLGFSSLSRLEHENSVETRFDSDK